MKKADRSLQSQVVSPKIVADLNGNGSGDEIIRRARSWAESASTRGDSTRYIPVKTTN
jgi:hypothetical protein